MDIRVTELASKETYVDINDLIIELLIKQENLKTDLEKKAYKDIIERLKTLRDKAHKGVKHVNSKS